MPAHDWTRVPAGTFHDFHQAWIVTLRNALNGGLLPAGYYALAEQVVGDAHPDVLALEQVREPGPPASGFPSSGSVVALADHPPRVRYTLAAEAQRYAAKADRLVVRHSSGDRIIAFVEVISPGNKQGYAAIRRLLDKLAAALQRGWHLLIVDLQPPGPHDPQGLHAAFWGGPAGVTADQPLAAAAYRAGESPTAYFQPLAVGDEIPPMPLFLTPDHYVDAPLEATYGDAWSGVPQRWKQVLERRAE